MFIVIVYDIQENRIRTKIAKILETFGERVQKSVFECDLNEKDINSLKSKISFLNFDIQDSIRFYYLEESSLKRMEKIGGCNLSINQEYYCS